MEAGARFLTSPGFVPEVVTFARKADVAVLPGALTPTEIIAAWKAGSDFVKIFPTGYVGGIQYVRALKVPLPQIPLIATEGGEPGECDRLYPRRNNGNWRWRRDASKGSLALSPGGSYP